MRNRTPTRPDVPDFRPVPRKCARHDGWTPARQTRFIEALADTGSVRHAAAAVGMAPEGAYQLRRAPGAEEFAAAWDAALGQCMNLLFDALVDRALNGVEQPVFSYGKQVGTRRVYNDRLGQFMLSTYSGRMSDGAGGLPLHMRRLVDRAVAEARAQWEAEREREDGAAQSATDRAREWLAEIDRRLQEFEEGECEEGEAGE